MMDQSLKFEDYMSLSESERAAQRLLGAFKILNALGRSVVVPGTESAELRSYANIPATAVTIGKPVKFAPVISTAKTTSSKSRSETSGRTKSTGTVKWFNTTKGYGFIAPEGGGKDVFVHISAVERSGLTGLVDNQKVEFNLEAGRDGKETVAKIEVKD